MPSVRRFEDLKVWQKSRESSLKIFDLTNRSGFAADHALVRQINAASGSVMDNIAEGLGRGGNKEFIQFLSYAKASAEEVKSQLYRALDRQYINQPEFEELYAAFEEIARMIQGLIKSLQGSDYRGWKFRN